MPHTFEYDKSGNRTIARVPDVTSYEVNDLDQYVRIDKASALGTEIESLKYDANGNLIEDGSTRYFFDSLNRLVEVEEIATGNTLKYQHDASGRRVVESADQEARCLVYSRNSVIAEYVSGKPVAHYVFNEDSGRPVQFTCDATERSFHSDLIGFY